MISPGKRPDYHQITACTESYFDRLGDSPLGMGWPNTPDAIRRYQIMLDVIRPQPSPAVSISILDLGCGCGHMYEYLHSEQFGGIRYTGIDLSERFIDQCHTKYPAADFRHVDVLQTPEQLEIFDYVILNGVFTSRCAMSFQQMWDFARSLLSLAFHRARHGIAFNAMAKHVDWERDDLFHLPLDTFAAFASESLSRHFVIRNDYGLYEFAAYVYHLKTGV